MTIDVSDLSNPKIIGVKGGMFDSYSLLWYISKLLVKGNHVYEIDMWPLRDRGINIFCIDNSCMS